MNQHDIWYLSPIGQQRRLGRDCACACAVSSEPSLSHTQYMGIGKFSDINDNFSSTILLLCTFINNELTIYCECEVSNTSSFARSDTGFVINSEPHPSRKCKSSLLFDPFAVRIRSSCSAFPFYITIKPLIRFHIRYRNDMFPKL